MPIPLLHTPHLLLRAQSAEDAPGLYRIFGDPATMRYWSRLPMQHLDEALARIERVQRAVEAGECVAWLLTNRDDGAVVGTLDIFKLEPAHRRCEFGYSLASSCWGRGWMTEAATAALDWAFAHLPLDRIEADTDPRNTASIRLLTRLGFTREGTLREKWRVGDEVSDSAVFGLLRREWEEKEEPSAARPPLKLK